MRAFFIYTRWRGLAKEGAYAGQHCYIMLLQCLAKASVAWSDNEHLTVKGYNANELQMNQSTISPSNWKLSFEVKSMKHILLLSALLCWNLASAAVDMPLQGLDGKESNLADYRGKWVVVNYWATWCPPCIEEMPELQAFHDEYADSKAVVLGINTEVMDEELIQAFLDDYFITYPNFTRGPVSHTPMGMIPGLPTTFLVSPEGKAEARQVGPVTREMIENFIDKWEANNNN